MQWIDQEAAENDKGFFKRMKKKGVSFIPVRREERVHTHPIMQKWEQAFIEAKKDGIPIMHYRNPITGENDLTILVFDNRMLQAVPERANTLSGVAYEDVAGEAEA